MTDQQSTPKEPLSFTPPKAMTRMAKTTQFISTRWAANIAWRWFLTPYPFKIPKREVPFEQRFGSPTMFTHENGNRYPVYQMGTGAKNILLIHGWAGRFTQFGAMIEAMETQYPSLLEEYTITGFNAVSHRGAEGKRTLMPEIAACIHQVTQHLGEVDLALAHSLGSNATMYAVQRLGAPIKRQVLIAPPGRISAMVGLFCNAIGFNTAVHAQIVDNLKAKFGEDFDLFSAPELAPSNTIPTLVFHDVDDKDTPISFGREVGEKMANGTYIETSGLGHRRILRDSKVIEQIMNWSFNIS
jgi:pimeloyl-ACP methyl ester carboxylesterase